MLKPNTVKIPIIIAFQPPSGGCVLKQMKAGNLLSLRIQPPSGGCVLKQLRHGNHMDVQLAAAFGRLCVETPTR